MEKSLRSLLDMMEKELPPLEKELQLIREYTTSDSSEASKELSVESQELGNDLVKLAIYVHTYTYALRANLVRADYRGDVEPEWKEYYLRPLDLQDVAAKYWSKLLECFESKDSMGWKELVRCLAWKEGERVDGGILTEPEELQREFKPEYVEKIEASLKELIEINTEFLKELNTNIKKFEEGPGLDLQPESAQGFETASTLKR